MFQAHRAHHQERQTVSIQTLVAVGGCVVCRSEVNFRPAHDTVTDTMTATRGCIDTIFSSWWRARCARNVRRVKNKNKYIEKNCTLRWSFTKNHYIMHGQQNTKLCISTTL